MTALAFNVVAARYRLFRPFRLHGRAWPEAKQDLAQQQASLTRDLERVTAER